MAVLILVGQYVYSMASNTFVPAPEPASAQQFGAPAQVGSSSKNAGPTSTSVSVASSGLPVAKAKAKRAEFPIQRDGSSQHVLGEVARDSAASVDSGLLKSECRLDSDCRPGLGCMTDFETGFDKCVPSECESDEHCFEGYACRTVNTVTSGPPLRRCTPIGSRRVGEHCSPFGDRTHACADGLICNFLSCGKPCTVGKPDDCEAGDVCLDEGRGDGPACYRGCAKSGCPSDQACIKLGAISKCARAVGRDCNQEKCPSGQECRTRIVREWALFQCLTTCQPLAKNACGTGEICGFGGGATSYCYQQCDSKSGVGCPPGLACRSVSEDDSRWGCVVSPPP